MKANGIVLIATAANPRILHAHATPSSVYILCDARGRSSAAAILRLKTEEAMAEAEYTSYESVR